MNNLLKNSLFFQKYLKIFDAKKSLLIDKLDIAEISSLISFAKKNSEKDFLIVTSDKNKDTLFENLKTFNENLFEFPSWETLPFEDIKPSPDIIGKRFETLTKLLSGKKNNTVICTIHSLLQKIVKKDFLKNLTLSFEVGKTINLDETVKKLIELGYKKASIVSDKSEFAQRGYILDIFPVNAKTPFRIELFSNEIESIRSFDNISQKSIKKVESFDIFVSDELELIKNQKDLTNISSHLSEDFILIFDDLLSIEDSLVSLNKLNIKNSKFFITFEEFLKENENRQKLFFSQNQKIENLTEVKFSEDKKEIEHFEIFNTSFKNFSYFFENPFTSFANFLNVEKIENILDHLNDLLSKNLQILFLINSDSEKKHLLEILETKNIETTKNISFADGFLTSGFILLDLNIALLPYFQVTNRKVIRRQEYRNTYHTPAAEFHHLQPGDLVVHFHSGIGKFLGVEKQANHLGVESEFLIIEYAKLSKLYVPIQQAHLVSRYIGSNEQIPTLNALGTNKWQKTRLTAQKQIIGYASDLLDVQATRQIEGGYKYPENSEETTLFELDFPYTETEDQKNAIEALKKDMQSTKAMDRLICGDVGYGKTEVAMRAAFKAVVDGKKQVAVLVPTTVLASQHYETFLERMSSFGINIEMVSRFNTAKKNKEIIENTKMGNVDILIGTHRILSKDVVFKDLGLIIIDEEQRFGVRAKEHLKKLKKGVDTLTLSATPIPRTLYMSIIKVKDMSIINTPPQDRLPIKTILSENDDEVIKNAILRELSRNGQVFFIHNRVESIHLRAKHIQSLIPNVKIQIVHGQMSSDAVDEIFHKFKKGEIDILFSTTIVENGIDIPNANTILIDRADAFSLADLYQLRGRVGRWNRSSYAYFLTPKRKEVSEISKKRLNALLEAPGYGGGMKIAMRDLEIRGAGDILGVKQSGQISNIGFHLYCKLLKKAIESIKEKKPTSFIETKVEFSMPAYIPDDYIEDSNIRMELYYRLGSVTSLNEVDTLLTEMTDRFSTPPEEVFWLICFTKIRVFANFENFTHLKFMTYTLFAEKQSFKKTKIQKTLQMIKPSKNPDEFFNDVKKLLIENFDI
ncbi:MAG: transcription-repair coupling factor [Parachlamydiales bacterium]|nr:transcription-repair coupling factor [Parachlamydiales bacterium]